MVARNFERSDKADWMPLDENVTELLLLLPRWQADALQDQAQAQGVTAGQLLRRLIHQYCERVRPLQAADGYWF